MSTYFFVVFEVHYMVFRYDVCLEEYMDLSPRLISGTKLEHTELMRRTKRSESKKKKLNNNQHEKFFLKSNIKSLIIMACPNIKYGHKKNGPQEFGD